MPEVGWGTLAVIPSLKGFQSALDKDTRGAFEAAGRRGGKAMGQVAGKEAADGIGASLRGLRDMAAPIGATLLGGGVVAGFQQIISDASTAEQSVGGVQAVFKEYADEVEADARRAAEGLGLSATAYRELVTVSGALLKNKGLKDFATQADTLVRVGADLAAQFGGSTREAVEALNAALRGESDPIERYAISLNETAVNAELAAKGQDKLKGAALEQAKTQARLALIQKQSADAQGAFARESETLAGRTARLSAEWANMRVELGEKFLPVASEAIDLLRDSALPALREVGDVVVAGAKAWADLPGPIQAAAGAFVAVRVAMATGIAGSIADRAVSSTAAISSGMDSMRLRTMMARDEYARMRSAQLTFINGAPKFTAASGRMAASMGAIRTAAAGMGSSISRGFSGLASVVGGPWGAAMIAGVAIFAKFRSEQGKAQQEVAETKARIDELTQAFIANKGAINEDIKAIIAKRLEDEGILKIAKEQGIALDLVTNAALGQVDAMAKLRDIALSSDRAFGQHTESSNARADAVYRVLAAVRAETPEVEAAAAAARRQAEATGKGAQATGVAAAQINDYRGKLKDARTALQELKDAEDERRNARLKDRRDAVGLAQALQDTRDELLEGARTLDINTQAGRDNMNALLDLAAQWNDSSDVVKNKRGAWQQMRTDFIDLADRMGYSRDQAEKMAREILQIPDESKTQINTPGLTQALRRLAELEAQLWTLKNFGAVGVVVGAAVARIGPTAQPSTATQPTTGGHQNTEGAPRRVASPGVLIEQQTVVAHDYNDFITQMDERQRRAALTGVE